MHINIYIHIYISAAVFKYMAFCHVYIRLTNEGYQIHS